MEHIGGGKKNVGEERRNIEGKVKELSIELANYKLIPEADAEKRKEKRVKIFELKSEIEKSPSYTLYEEIIKFWKDDECPEFKRILECNDIEIIKGKDGDPSAEIIIIENENSLPESDSLEDTYKIVFPYITPKK